MANSGKFPSFKCLEQARPSGGRTCVTRQVGRRERRPRVLCQGSQELPVDDHVSVPPDGGGEVGVVLQGQAEVGKASVVRQLVPCAAAESALVMQRPRCNIVIAMLLIRQCPGQAISKLQCCRTGNAADQAISKMQYCRTGNVQVRQYPNCNAPDQAVCRSGSIQIAMLPIRQCAGQANFTLQ